MPFSRAINREVLRKKNARVHFAATVASKIAVDYSVWTVEHTAREGVQNTHH